MDATPLKLDPKHAFQNLSGLLDDDVQAVEKLLIERAASPVSVIPNLSGYIVAAGGKRLRPLITLAAAKACNATEMAPVHSLAAAVEFIHTATLLHDDVVDESDLRRGKPAAKNVWGNSASILVGDFLFARAFTLMVETGRLAVLDILSNASSVIAEGEVHQLAVQGQLDLPTEDYLKIIEAKTAALFEAAAESGAVCADADESQVRALKAYGRNLGLAFQLVDDALDYGGTTAVIGKTVGDDFRECKITLPVVIARRRGTDEDKSFWDRALNPDKQTDADLPHAIHLIRSTGAAKDTLAEARSYIEIAKKALAPMPKSDYREALLDLADFCVDRAY
ncbi:MAG: farnesyltranstransferase [Ponticaulis sp.]|nr:farnesyltranstransferase [Ponticaulis sp.]